MLNLTAAAEAIEDAYNSSPPCNDHVFDHKCCLAAALRAVVKQVEFPPRSDADHLWNEGFQYAQKAVLRDILNIADELEGVKYGIYRSPWPRQ